MAKETKTLECYICKKTFSYKLWNLRRHLEQHDSQIKNEKCVKCLECNKSFQNAGNYKVHCKTYHQNISFSRIGEISKLSFRF